MAGDARDQRSGMQSYARGDENTAPTNGKTRTGGADDLKLPVPGQGKNNSSNTQARRKKSNEATGHRPTTRSKSQSNLSGLAQQQRNAFYNADAESLDDTTIATGTPQNDVYGADRLIKQELRDGDDFGPADRAHYNQTHPDSSYRPPPSLPNTQPEHDEMNRRADGRGLPLQKGDSYPPTTSGNPSTTDANELPQRQQMNGNAQNPVQIGHLPHRGSGTRIPPGAAAKSGKPGKQAPTHLNKSLVPGLPNETPENIIESLGSGFQFARAPQAGKFASAQQRAAAPVPNQAATSGLDPRAPFPTNVRVAQPDQHEQQNYLPTPQVERSLHQQRKPANEERSLRQDTRGAAAAVQPASRVQPQTAYPERTPPEHQSHVEVPYSDEDGDRQGNDGDEVREDADGDEEGDEQMEEEQESEDSEDEQYASGDGMPIADPRHRFGQNPPNDNPLDYELQRLSEMQFGELQAQPFDFDPSARQLEFSEGHENDTFQEKLQMVTRSSRQDKIDFFTSMSMEDWEEAGDWFLERFGDIAKKFKAARQEKRKATQELEKEVAVRHEAVAKKRKLTEDALGEMRESGGRVLSATPKKMRKSR